MSKIVDLLDRYSEFTNQDKQVLDIYFGGLDTNNLTLSNQSSSRGSGYSFGSGNVDITFEEGISLFHPDTGERTIWLDPDGDALFGWDVTDPGKTALAIFAGAQWYNGETLGKGDLLIGDNSDDKANILWDYSTGELVFRSGTTVSVTIGDGGIVAEWGTIGGWSIDATRIYKSQIELDSAADAIRVGTNKVVLDTSGITAIQGVIAGWTIDADEIKKTGIKLNSANDQIEVGAGVLLDGATQTIQVGAGAPTIDIDGANKVVKSSNFSGGASGFQLAAVSGDAEFNNIVARGTFRTSVFQFENLTAVGGHLVVSKSAAEVNTEVTTGATFTLVLKNDDVGAVLVAEDDILELKGWNGTELIDVYVTAGVVTDQGATASFTATLNSGGTGKVLQRGMAAVNLGQSGGGIITLQAGDLGDAAIPTRLAISTHAGAPWTTRTSQVVLGDMYGSYGASTNHRYGIGLGDYSSGDYLSYNAETAGKFILSAGGGKVQLDELGISVDQTTGSNDLITWRDGANVRAKISQYVTAGDGFLEVTALAPSASNQGMWLQTFADGNYYSHVTLRPKSGTIQPSFQIYTDSNATPKSEIIGSADRVQWTTEGGGASYVDFWIRGGLRVGVSGAPADGEIWTKGQVIVNSPGTGATGMLTIRGAAGQHRQISFQSGSSERWRIFGADNAAESGSNVGSDFQLHRYADNGAWIAAALKITRSTGAVDIYGTTTIGSGSAYASLVIKGSAASTSDLIFKSGSDNAAILRRDTNDDLIWLRYTPAGTYVDAPLILHSSTGNVIFRKDALVDGLVDAGQRLRAKGSTNPSSGAGLELSYGGGIGYVFAYDRDASAYKPLNLRGTEIQVVETGVATHYFDGGDFYTTAWGEFLTSTITGWTTYTFNKIYYKKVGKTIFVSFVITGTSNANTTSFTLPYACSSLSLSTQVLVRTMNSGTYQMSFLNLNSGSSLVSFHKDVSSDASNTWATSGTKKIFGTFVYEAA